jgi:putative MATE family efflux protein
MRDSMFKPFKNAKLILSLAIPNIFSFATATVTGAINLILVGGLGGAVIAVVGVTNIIMYNAWAIFSGLGHSINYLVAQSYGAGNHRQAVERTHITLYVVSGLFLAIVLAGLIGSWPLLMLVTGSAELADLGAGYAKLRFTALAIGLFSFVISGFLRGIGDTRTPALLTVLGSVLMVFFTYALTYGHFGFPELGLTGAGVAFLIGEAFGAAGSLFVFFVLLHKKMRTRKPAPFDRKEARLILEESGKLGLTEFALSLSMFIFTVFVGRLGTVALAANEVALNIMSLGFMPAFAFGATATILVGQEIGRGNPLGGRRFGTETAVYGGIFLLTIGILEFMFALPIAKIYTDEPEIYTLVAKLISVSAFLQLFDGLLNFYAGGLRGIGDTGFLMKSSIVCGFALFVPLAALFIFGFGWGSMGAWLSLYLYLTIFAAVVMYRYYRTDWLSVRLKSADDRAAGPAAV